MEKEYTITVFTENHAGLLSRVVSVFTRRHINIESLTTSASSIPGIHRFTIVVRVPATTIDKLVGQLDKQVEVLKAFAYENDEIVHQELALYKVPTEVFNNNTRIEQLIRSHNARILEIEPKYIVIEKTGHPEEIDALLAELRHIGIYEFVRSGRVAIVRPMERLNRYLREVSGPNEQ